MREVLGNTAVLSSRSGPYAKIWLAEFKRTTDVF